MADTRLRAAIEAVGGLPSGDVAVFRPRRDEDLSPLSREGTIVVQGFRPDHDAFVRQGFRVVPAAEGRFAAAVVFATRSRDETRTLIADAVARLPEGAHLWVDGQKTDGIDGILKDLRRLGLEVAATSKAHGKCLAFRSPGARAFRQWEPVPRSPAPGFAVPPGVFSADGIDPASALLAAQLPVKLSGRIGDLGAGWGWLSAEVLKRPDVTECHLVEAEFAAIEAARQAIADPRAVFHWADATTFRLPRPLDGIVMNPPFHEGRQAEPALGQAFIRAAAAMLAPHGRLWMVANRQLPYERTLADCFREVEEAPGDGRFKVLFAAHPKRLRPRLT